MSRIPERPAHDPLSEEMDLLTCQEAAARLYDQAEVAEAEIADLEELGDQATEAQREDLGRQQDPIGGPAPGLRALGLGAPRRCRRPSPSSGWH